MKKIGLLMTMLCASVFVFAQANAAYTVDVAKSTLKWNAAKVVGEHHGTVGIKDGTVNTTGNAITGGTFVIDMTSIVCIDNARVGAHLLNQDFFEVDKFPTATFVISKVTPGANGATVTGKLTVKGITKDLTFPAQLSVDGNSLNAKANITVNRLEYDLRYRSAAFFSGLGDRAIKDEFIMTLDLTATRK
jgi:polyisoprenoid-binding protein YceI